MKFRSFLSSFKTLKEQKQKNELRSIILSIACRIDIIYSNLQFNKNKCRKLIYIKTKLVVKLHNL